MLPHLVHDTPGGPIEVWSILGRPFRAELHPRPHDADPPDADIPGGPEAVDACWARLRAANPRLHDGPILGVRRFDAAAARLVCEPERYRRFAVGAELPLGVEAVGVSGLITRSGRTADDDPEVLLACRGAGVRIYAGLWESAPRGGVPPPDGLLEPPGPRELSLADFARALADEADEELGAASDARLPMPALTPVAIVRDAGARSLDVVLAGHLTGRAAGAWIEVAGRGWEYAAIAWTPIPELPRRPDLPLSPPCEALMLAMGWL